MRIYFVDAFTNVKFKGNPAAVCLPESNLDETTMQNIASEIGFSKTAFIKNRSHQTYDIRFFTPKKEIPLCGHATLASSKIIFETTNSDRITFINVENTALPINKVDHKIRMQFPVYDTEEIKIPQRMLDALGIQETIDIRYSLKNKIIVVEIKEAGTLANLQPDFPALVNSYHDINGVLVSASSPGTDFDFHYRYFWPWAGTNEDPVTGGVQTFLTKYWAAKLGKNKLNAFQSSQRTGTMSTELFPDKVYIYGEAIIVFEGQLKN